MTGAQTRAELKAKHERARYISSTRPKRIEAHLRSENITDQEVAELQVAARAVLPGAIVNIGGVTSDCPCEDGPRCSAQVWVVAYEPKQTIGLMFSKIDGHWAMGPVQAWWRRYDELQSKHPRDLAWLEQQEKLFDAFPACGIRQDARADR